MEKIIHSNENSSLKASLDSGIVELTQVLEGEIIGVVVLYADELNELNQFVKENNGEEN